MTNALAVLPTFNRDDVKAARAWALSYGEPIGTKGRLPMWLLLDWDRNLRPRVVVAESNAPASLGKRGRRSTVIDSEGRSVEVSRSNARSARAWLIGEGIDVPAKGRLNAAQLQLWANAGMPDMAVREERATVYYVKRNAITGNLYSKMHAITVYADMLPGGKKPKHSDYVDAIELPSNATVVRITTANTIVNVTVDDDTGEYVYRWVSKADSREVVNTLKANLLLHT